MKKFLVSFAFSFFCCFSFSQENDYKQNATLGVHFFLNDFASARNIRTTSLSTTIREKKFGKTGEMIPGLAINFLKGFSNHLDLTTTLAASFVDYPQNNRPAFGSDNLLLEMDASIRGKMVSNNYWVSPYVQLGLGLSKYKGYYGAFIPAGVGLQLNFFDEAYLLVNSQYRIPITENTSYHFFYSIGLAGNIGKR